MKRLVGILLVGLPFVTSCYDHDDWWYDEDDVIEWYVTDWGSDDHYWSDGSYWAPFRSISHAVEHADDNDLVIVEEGDYDTYEDFPISVGSDITIRGDIGDKGAGTDPTFVSGSHASGLFILSSGATLKGFKIANSGGPAVVVTGAATVEYNTITGGSGDGIQVSGTAAPTINNNDITSNAGHGVLVSNSATPTLRSNLIATTTGDGVHADDTSLPNLGNASGNGNNTLTSSVSGPGVGLNNNTTNSSIPAYGNTFNASATHAGDGTVFGTVLGSATSYDYAITNAAASIQFPP